MTLIEDFNKVFNTYYNDEEVDIINSLVNRSLDIFLESGKAIDVYG
ncbi:MAG: hypothetical protein ACR5K4_00070 [Sodalis sp. (in: enterobacteria)]